MATVRSGGNGRNELLDNVVAELSSPDSYMAVAHRANHEVPMPSVQELRDIVEQLRTVLFPGYFGPADLRPETVTYYVGATLDRVSRQLAEQVKRGFCFACAYDYDKDCRECEKRARSLADRFLSRLPEVRNMLALDVQAAFEGDPAARQPGEG
ncbi:MAG: serine acetyltransferase, partial [Deltaproteobacteria bacterium]|nr:serine acetyltransferase [Deltaproteobacteria bacterium]